MVYVHRKVAFATVIAGVKFLPGMNTISDGEMKIINSNPRSKKTFEGECLVNMRIGGTVDSETSNAATPNMDMKTRAAEMAKEIASVNVEEAKKLIEKIGDGYILRALAQIDGRKGVADAVNNRIASIDGQEGSDLTPENREAPDGSGDDFLENLGTDKNARSGTKGHSAIPALNKG
ncbi:hypothetical protein KAR91_48785 [Candidatus Pacearchaeota archaeon]|nr:hypothetical protein [Candidatus Pacearchaeota archaeon]